MCLRDDVGTTRVGPGHNTPGPGPGALQGCSPSRKGVRAVCLDSAGSFHSRLVSPASRPFVSISPQQCFPHQKISSRGGGFRENASGTSASGNSYRQVSSETGTSGPHHGIHMGPQGIKAQNKLRVYSQAPRVQFHLPHSPWGALSQPLNPSPSVPCCAGQA